MGKYIKKTNPEKRGPKYIEINKQQFEKLCGICATLAEISGWFGVSDETIERWCLRTYQKQYREIWQEKSSFGKVSIRRKQIELAQQGNVPLLIWLGKQLLGQKDVTKTETELKVRNVDESKLKEMPTEELIKSYFDELSSQRRQH